MAGKKKKKKYRIFWFFVRLQIVFLVILGAAAAYYFFGGYADQVQEMKIGAERLVRTSTRDTFRGNQTSIVYAADGSVISTLKGVKDSYYLELDEMPVNVVSAIVSIEDKKFYRHGGVDYRAMVRAVKEMIENGEATQGGSTITMQLARNIFLSQEKTWKRKIEEIFVAWNLEEKYTKDEILEFYLNNIYFGNGYYGIQSASRGYFDRDVQELDLSQIAFLCAIPNNPTLYDPVNRMNNTVSRRNRILKHMLQDGKISERSYREAAAARVELKRPQVIGKNDYVETYTYYSATRALMENEDFEFRYSFTSKEEKAAYNEAYENLYSVCQKKLYTGGYRIYTSFDLGLQEELQWSVDETLGGFTETNEEGIYALQASAVCIDNESGYVKAIVGGREQEFAGYTLNRAYQSFRQPGSAIKPLSVYTPSFERNYTPDSMVVDEPIEGGPKNASGTYAGKITLRTAVERSINTVAWRLYEELTPQLGLSYLRDMNFSRLDAEDYRLPSALGGFTNGVSALEMAAGYAALENDGKYRMPTCIVKIEDADGNEVYTSNREEKQIYKQNASRMMTDVLVGAIKNGTGRGLALTEMPAAGKTGTTNDNKDGWFVGYTRYYTTSVWVGYDMPRKMDKLMGSTYPGKIWNKFMEQAHDELPYAEFLPYVKLSGDFSNQNSFEGGTNLPEETIDGNRGAEEQSPVENIPPQDIPIEQQPEEGVPPAENPPIEQLPEEGGAPENIPPENIPSENVPMENGAEQPPAE